MSFSEDPYKHLSIVIRDTGVFAGIYCWECSSCGAEVPLAENAIAAASMPINTARHMFLQHVKRSHDLTSENTKDWD